MCANRCLAGHSGNVLIPACGPSKQSIVHLLTVNSDAARSDPGGLVPPRTSSCMASHGISEGMNADTCHGSAHILLGIRHHYFAVPRHLCPAAASVPQSALPSSEPLHTWNHCEPDSEDGSCTEYSCCCFRDWVRPSPAAGGAACRLAEPRDCVRSCRLLEPTPARPLLLLLSLAARRNI